MKASFLKIFYIICKNHIGLKATPFLHSFFSRFFPCHFKEFQKCLGWSLIVDFFCDKNYFKVLFEINNEIGLLCDSKPL